MHPSLKSGAERINHKSLKGSRHRRANRRRSWRWTLVRDVHPTQCRRSADRRFCGGGPRPQDKDLLAGLLVSVLGDEAWVAELLAADWVDTWGGWDEMAQDGTDATAMNCAERFLRLADANVSLQMQSDTQRLQDLRARGLRLQKAESHGVNNCLIDSLLLALTAQNLTLHGRQYSRAERKNLCARCRTHLGRHYGIPTGTYLDGHTDAPRTFRFFPAPRVATRCISACAFL